MQRAECCRRILSLAVGMQSAHHLIKDEDPDGAGQVAGAAAGIDFGDEARQAGAA